MRMGRSLVLATVLLTTSILSPAGAQTFHGRLTTSFYAWERSATDTLAFEHLRAYQLAILHLEGLADRRLSFHTYVRAHSDLREEVSELSNYQVYNLYAQWKDARRGYELRGGRMRIYAGAGNVAIDGGWGSYTFRDLATLEAYVGVQPPLGDDLRIESWKNRAYGGRLTFRRPQSLKLALSFARRNRETLKYDEPGIYTGRLLELPDEQEELYGADLSWQAWQGASVYGRVEFDATQHRLKYGGGVFSYASSGEPWTADIEYFHRAPSLYGNTLLSVFNHGNYDEVSARGGYQLTPRVRLFGHVAHTVLEDDSSQRFGVGVERDRLSVSFNHRMGYGGDLDAVTAAYHRSLDEWMAVRVSGGVSSFKTFDEQSDRNVSFNVAGGWELRPRRTLTIDLEIQNLTQDLHTQPAFAGYTHDVRGLVRVTYWFFTGRRVGGAF